MVASSPVVGRPTPLVDEDALLLPRPELARVIERMKALAQDEGSADIDRQRAIEILEELGPSAMAALAEIANDGDSTDRMRGPALRALRSVTREASLLGRDRPA